MTWGRVCHYCGHQVFDAAQVARGADGKRLRTHDHKIPKSTGVGKGEGGGENLVTSCQSCNSLKGDAPYEVFRYFIRNRERFSGSLADALAFRQFKHDLTLAGLKACFSLIAYQKRQAAKDGEEKMSRRRRATETESGEDEPAPLPAYSAPPQRKPYTLKDLRRGERLSPSRAADKKVVSGAVAAIAKLDALKEAVH